MSDGGDDDRGAIAARVSGGVGAFDRDEWNALAGSDNPFVSWEFLTALEDSGSVGPGTGWQPAPIVISAEGGPLLAAMPSYVKGHSQGEYVFDHAWADAWERAGGAYYPKLQIAAPFTPASGPRLLLSDPAYAAPLLAAAEQLCAQNGFSSAHATFIEPAQQALFDAAGWLMRRDIQFHWANHDYADFDGFLASLSSRKRRDLRKERAAAQADVAIVQLRGDDIRPEHWDAFWEFYQDTGARKWGTPYLTRAAFDLLGERMGDRLLLVLAYQDGMPIARRAQFHRRRHALWPILGRSARRAFPAFRAVLLSGNRRGDRHGSRPDRGGRAGRAQAGPRVYAGGNRFGALDRRPRLSPCSHGIS